MPSGELCMAATHIGNLRDIPSRSLEAVRSADLLIFEEDRPARQVLKAAGIHRDYFKLNEHHQKETLEEVAAAFRKGKRVVYLSDQGSPTFADPGKALLDMAYSAKVKVSPIPGPCSLSAALSVCPFPIAQFFFAGFPPRDTGERQRYLQKAVLQKVAVVLMDTPYRLSAILADLSKITERQVFVSLDISGDQEQQWLGRPAQLVAMAKKIGKLNFILIIDRAS